MDWENGEGWSWEGRIGSVGRDRVGRDGVRENREGWSGRVMEWGGTEWDSGRDGVGKWGGTEWCERE